MFDCILPIGQTCNITFLLQNAKIKKETTLFEWFISPSVKDITNVLTNIVHNRDAHIIKQIGRKVYIGNNINSDHYTYEDFKTIYQRRRSRLLSTIKSSKKILFCRFEAKPVAYTKEDIDAFINTVLMINKDLEDIKLLLIGPSRKFEHPSLIKVTHDNHSADPYCKGKEINDLFVNTLKKVGYNLNDTTNVCFTDTSEL
jgi:hypothetical protein